MNVVVESNVLNIMLSCLDVKSKKSLAHVLRIEKLGEDVIFTTTDGKGCFVYKQKSNSTIVLEKPIHIVFDKIIKFKDYVTITQIGSYILLRDTKNTLLCKEDISINYPKVEEVIDFKCNTPCLRYSPLDDKYNKIVNNVFASDFPFQIRNEILIFRHKFSADAFIMGAFFPRTNVMVKLGISENDKKLLDEIKARCRVV